MGLDMYAYTASRRGQYDEWWSAAEINPETNEFECPDISKPAEISYWRKHPNLHGWMERLWQKKTDGIIREKHEFNGVELELTREDLDQLEHDVAEGFLPQTSGFFFGTASDEYYKAQDLEFIKQARMNMFLGLRVFYNSSW
jgi:hypothetical protein